MASLGLADRAALAVSRLSGGQRKRVSIGSELLTNPGLFFLDEATSGLDPGNEAQMMRLLRGLADDGHTVLLATHATRNVRLCDQVVFLARGGRLAFYGPPEEALGYFGVAEFDEIYPLLDDPRPDGEWERRYEASAAHGRYVAGRRGLAGSASAAAEVPARRRDAQPGPFRQWSVLARRQFDILRRDRVGLAILLAIAPLVGLANFLQWPRDLLSFERGNATDALAMAFLGSYIPFLLGAISSVREVAKEAPIFARERAVNIGVLPYVLSKTGAGVVISAYHALALTALLIAAVHFPGAGAVEYLAIFLTLALIVVAGTMWGLLVSSLSPREDQALLIVIGVVVLHLVFSGGIVPTSDLGPASLVADGAATNWGFKGLTAATGVLDSGCEAARLANCTLPGLGQYPSESDRALVLAPIRDHYAGVFGANLYTCWAAIGAISLACFAGLYARQRLRH